MRAMMQSLGYGDAKIQATTEQIRRAERPRATRSRPETLQPPALVKVKTGLNQLDGGINQDSYQVDTVGPTFGAQIIRNAIYAIIISASSSSSCTSRSGSSTSSPCRRCCR